MAFDAGRFQPPYLPEAAPERRTLEDMLDFVLRILVIVPLIALYTWFVASLAWRAVLLIIPG